MKKILALSVALMALASCSSSDDNSKVAPIETISEGTVFGGDGKPLNVGGPNQQNQVYVDLSGEAAATAPRDSWDLGFYSGNDFRVVINGGVAMAVKKLETGDMSVLLRPDNAVAVGTFDVTNLAYVDNANGGLEGTAFGTIAANKDEARVYLVNMGNAIPTELPEPGYVNTAGTPRGWKKVKIWKEGEGYKLQYGSIDSAEFTEVAIAKDPAYNHVFFSLATGQKVMAEPKKENWDLNFTTFTNEVFDNAGVSAGAYFYSDYIVTNTKAGVTAFMVEGDNAAYEAFNQAAITAGNHTFSTDQRAIGERWRSVFDRVTFDNVFFVVKDTEGHIYKVKFISMVDAQGHRGFPKFRYALVK